jgi:cation diffusion facilitator family transporter
VSESADNANGSRGVQRVIVVTLILNLVVAALKIGYGYGANALSIRADGFHSLTDSANNVVGMWGIMIASRPPDQGHPYGHRKYELLAAGVVGLSLLGMAYDVAKSAIGRWLTPGSDLPAIDATAFVVLIVTLAINLFVARYEYRRGRELKSPFLMSDAVHTRSDVIVTLGVLLAVVLVWLGYPRLDMVAAFLVALYIGWTGIGVLRENLAYLADSALVEPAKVDALALEVPGVASTHKIRTRGIPGQTYIDLHIQIAPHLNVVEAHRVTHAVIDAIKAGVPGVADVVVHTEPARPDQPYKPLPEPSD